MLKLTFCLHRLPHLSREQFQRYWLEKHGPLVRSFSGVLRIQRYVQMHTTSTPYNAALQESRGGPSEYDGVAELWWNRLDDIIAAVATDAGRAAGLALLEDERKFIDLARSPLFVGEEHELIG